MPYKIHDHILISIFFLPNTNIKKLLKISFVTVSYTHLDVYKRQQVRFGIVRLKRMRQPELASAFFVYIVCKQCSGVIGKCTEEGLSRAVHIER